MFADALSTALLPFVWAFGFVAELLSYAGALPVYFAIFAACVVVRMFVRPIVGESQNESGKQNNKKTKGGV